MMMVLIYANKTTPNTRFIDTHAKLTSTEFVSLFDSVNHSNIKNFVDKAIEVKGVLKKMTLTEGVYTLLLTSHQKDRYVLCKMQNDQNSNIVNLSPGETIVLKGVFKGVLLDAILLNCIIIDQNNL